MDCEIIHKDGRKEMCTECCKWMTFILEVSNDQLEGTLDFYVTRGCKTQVVGKSKEFSTIAFTVPTTCPERTVDGCRINHRKPNVCRNYDCRQDRFLKGGKYYGMHIEAQEKEKTQEKEEEVKGVPEHKKHFPITLQDE